MIVAEIISEQTKQKVCDVLIPETRKEIKYSAFVEFTTKADAIFNWMREEQELNKEYDIQYIVKICDTVASVLDVDPNILRNLKYKENKWITDAWLLIHKIISDYKPYEKQKSFECGGKTWMIPELTRSIIRNEVDLEGYTFQQMKEVSYIQKKLNDVLFALNEKEKNEKGYNKETDMIAQTVTYTLMKLAVLLSDPMEIPNDATFDKWLDERVLELENISMEDALDAIFFLIGYPKDLGVLIDLGITLNKFLCASYTKRTEATMQPE